MAASTVSQGPGVPPLRTPMFDPGGNMTMPWVSWLDGVRRIVSTAALLNTAAAGTGAVLLGANAPVVAPNLTAPYVWLTQTMPDGTKVVVPAWKQAP